MNPNLLIVALNKAIFILLLVQICLIQFSSLIMLRKLLHLGDNCVHAPYISPLVHATLPGSHSPTCSGVRLIWSRKLPSSLYPLEGDEKEIIRRGIKIIAPIPAAIVAAGMRCGVLHKMELFICHLNNVLPEPLYLCHWAEEEESSTGRATKSGLASLS